MDMIYTNKNRIEQGIITDYTFDQEDTTTANDCTFEIQIPSENNVLEVGAYVYIPGTELGGRVDAIKVDTSANVIYASGRTWRGLLATKLLYNSNESYEITGNIASVTKQLLTDYGMINLFDVKQDTSIPATSVSVDKYTDLYYGILQAASAINYKMHTVFVEALNKVEISFEPIGMYTNANIITSDMFSFVLQTGLARVNHAIGTSETMTIHRYLNAAGVPSDTQYYRGIDEIVAVYESSKDTEVEMIAEIDERLLQERTDDKLDVTAYDLQADLGDLFEAEDIQTGIKMSQNVTRKIAKINHDIVTYQYKVGERKL